MSFDFATEPSPFSRFYISPSRRSYEAIAFYELEVGIGRRVLHLSLALKRGG